MATSTNFTPEEWKVLRVLPFVVAGTSLTIIHPNALKALKTALSIYPIVLDTSTKFPENECIQAIFSNKGEEGEEHNKIIETHGGKNKDEAIALRNDLSEQAITILNQKSPPQESEEYRRWLLLIAATTMHKGQSNGFLGRGKDRAEAEIEEALQDFSRLLHISE
jgi:hypothetical protein